MRHREHRALCIFIFTTLRQGSYLNESTYSALGPKLAVPREPGLLRWIALDSHPLGPIIIPWQLASVPQVEMVG